MREIEYFTCYDISLYALNQFFIFAYMTCSTFVNPQSQINIINMICKKFVGKVVFPKPFLPWLIDNHNWSQRICHISNTLCYLDLSKTTFPLIPSSNIFSVKRDSETSFFLGLSFLASGWIPMNHYLYQRHLFLFVYEHMLSNKMATWQSH